MSSCNKPFIIINNTLTNAAGYQENRLKEGLTVTVPIDADQMRGTYELSL